MKEDMIKNLLYFCYLNEVEISKEYLEKDKKEDILNLLKEELNEDKYIELKRTIEYYTHFNEENKIDLSELPLNEENEVEHINLDYKIFIGKKIPFIYNGINGVLEIISISMLYMEDGSKKVNEGYQYFEEKYNTPNLLIVDKYMVKYGDKKVFISTKELLDVNLEKII